MKKILVVGGVAGGASFAARMRRLDESARIIMFDKGDYISFANCGLPYFIGDTIKERGNLIIQTPEKFKARFGVEVRVGSEVTAVNAAEKKITVTTKDSAYEESYDFLLLAPGCTPIKPPVPGIDSPAVHTLRTIPDADAIRAMIDKNKVKSAVVVGGGFIGLEMAEELRRRGIDVSIVELLDQVFAPADREMAGPLHQHLILNGVRLMLGRGLNRIVDDGGKAAAILDDGVSLPADLIILAVGVRPDTAFLKESGIALSQRGAIVVDESLRTNTADVFAVGDAVEVTDFVSGTKTLIPLAGPANRQGRIAADNVAGLASVYRNTQGTAICKIFDLTAAVSGLNEKSLRRLGIPFMKSYTHSASHASYYPGAYPLSIKILFAPDTGRLLGAQVIGRDGVDKRIDVFATAIRHRLTVDDLAELELAYAPPYGSAKDPVNVAGFTAQNILRKRMQVFFAEDVAGIDPKKQLLLDVRTIEEHDQGTIPGARNIPLDGLRGRLGELDRSREIFVFCQVGLRGYLATRILEQHGFAARNLSGGYKTWSAAATVNYDATFIKPVSEAACATPVQSSSAVPSLKVDACGMQCPGPIMKIKAAVDSVREGELVEVRATDQGFAADIPAWCGRTGNTLVSLINDRDAFVAVVKKGASDTTCEVPGAAGDRKTMVIFSNDFDRMMAAFIIANGAAAMGSAVTLFFTFWGLNLLRKDNRVPAKKSLIERMFGIMMPRGSAHTTLSKMHMAGLGTAMMRGVMRKKKVSSLEDLIEQAREAGVRFVACTMSMDVMGIKKEELIDGIEFGGVAAYLANADKAGYNLFI
jgi:NADPH-dependent 2,4-dienoyl-CoA reductase/sulfur reductase-like enzyme/peroxiredoxin family protein/rhodanese-related sulfurtransferase/TusA-related sulfurtransferase